MDGRVYLVNSFLFRLDAKILEPDLKLKTNLKKKYLWYNNQQDLGKKKETTQQRLFVIIEFSFCFREFDLLRVQCNMS